MKKLNYDEPILIAEGIYWIGFYDKERNLHCNPYLVTDGEEAVIIDGGSRTDFSTVMTKILQAGVSPSSIKRLIYQHYDPDLCSSIPNFEDIITSKDLRILSQKENNVFIRYYAGKSRPECIDSLGGEYTTKGGRKLRFIHTPYAHSPGSFVTYDEKTKTLFSSDLFGSYDDDWELYVEFQEDCGGCNDFSPCPKDKEKICPLPGIFKFHKKIMTSSKALCYALKEIESLSIERIAPQHGSIIEGERSISVVINRLKGLEDVGIDSFI